MRFSDTTQFQIPQPTKYANSDSSPFNSDESLSDEDASQTCMTQSTTPDQNSSQESTPFITSNHKSLTPPTNDNSLYKNIINTPHTNTPNDRSRHPSKNQTDSLLPQIDRTTTPTTYKLVLILETYTYFETTYKLRHQHKLDYRLFIPPSKL